jgi:hypothetical protein
MLLHRYMVLHVNKSEEGFRSYVNYNKLRILPAEIWVILVRITGDGSFRLWGDFFPNKTTSNESFSPFSVLNKPLLLFTSS